MYQLFALFGELNFVIETVLNSVATHTESRLALNSHSDEIEHTFFLSLLNFLPPTHTHPATQLLYPL